MATALPLWILASRSRAVFVAFGLGLAALTGCDGARPGSSFLSIGTGGTGGVYYPLGGALAARMSAADSTRQYTAEVTGGSVENVNRVAAGQIDLGFALSVSAHEAFHGGADLETPVADLRIVAPLYANLVHVLVRRNSDVSTMGDLSGHVVSVGSAGSGTEQISRQLLEAYGLSYDDVEARFLTFNESAAALRDGAIEAAVISVGFPAAAVLEATTTGGARLLPLDEAGLGALLEAHPYYFRGTIPSGVYSGVDEPVATAAMMNWIVAKSTLNDAVVTRLLNVLRDERVSLERVHEMARSIDLDALDSAPIPLHPAVEVWRMGR